ncbi:AlpA family phage regulatory protein [Fodinicurvata sp. EGI_FJ10296]|uniref:helix-turn-helix transcriptional regulator n=1 Tax=Fodinicurvata sp. EGI_FJ10296 TaxID=3231908 RepID=UPI003455D91C
MILEELQMEGLAEKPRRPVTRMLRISEVEEMTGLKRPTIYKHVKLGTFPRQQPLGCRAVGWRLDDIVGWLESQGGQAVS